MDDSKPDLKLFWGCFLALITTAFAFISRMFLLDTWEAEFTNLTAVQKGELAGDGNLAVCDQHHRVQSVH